MKGGNKAGWDKDLGLNVLVFFWFAADIPDYHNRVSYVSDLVKSLPPENHDTMEALFSHLRKYVSSFVFPTLFKRKTQGHF